MHNVGIINYNIKDDINVLINTRVEIINTYIMNNYFLYLSSVINQLYFMQK